MLLALYKNWASAWKLEKQTKKENIESIAGIYNECIPKESNHKLWIESSFSSYPSGVYYVISIEGKISGYILWCVKNGFRDNTIIELEQIGIHPGSSGKGLGRTLIEITLDKFKDHLSSLGHNVGAIIVTTSEGNFSPRPIRPVAALKNYPRVVKIFMQLPPRSGLCQWGRNYPGGGGVWASNYWVCILSRTMH